MTRTYPGTAAAAMAVTMAVTMAVGAAPAQATALTGFAVLPAETFIPGPTSGQFTGPRNGVTPPFNGLQPVQGFSSIIPGAGGRYLAMSDNGFGSKANSPDALLYVHDLTIDFRTETGGSGTVTVNTSTALSDPNSLITFPIVADQTFYPGGPNDIPVDAAIRDSRLLTGADFDIESFRRDANGNFWFGDEFGPFLFKTNDSFEVIAAPIQTPGVQSVDSPLLGGDTANLRRSRGLEGMGVSDDGLTLYAMLEGNTEGSPSDILRIFEFDVVTEGFTGTEFLYQLDAGGRAIGELSPVGGDRYLVIERDGGGEGNIFKKLFLIDLNETDADGILEKTLVADLLDIDDPFDLNGDGLTAFTFPFVTIESVTMLDPTTLLIANDNNFPGGGQRIPGVPENSEFITISLDRPLLAVTGPSPLLLMLTGFGLLGLGYRLQPAPCAHRPRSPAD